MYFPLKNTILILYKNVVYCSSLDIHSNCNKNSRMSVLPVSVNKAYSGTSTAVGKKSQKKKESKNEARLKSNICSDKHSLENGFLGLLVLKLQH